MMKVVSMAGKCVLTLASLCFITGLVMSQSNQPVEGVASAAQKVWDLAIEAKGGRQRIYKIEVVVEHSSSRARTHTGKVYERKGVAVIALPHKVWSYRDDGPSVFGRTAVMLDYENMTEYFWADGRKNVLAEPMPNEYARGLKAYQNTTIFYLMESRWLKPTLLGMKSSSINGEKVFVIETDMDGRRVDFGVSHKTYLPIKIFLYDVGSNGVTYKHEMLLEDYKEIDGIKVPLRTKYDDQGWETSTIQFNVDYDPSIFLRAPDNLGPDSWRPKSNRGS